MRDIHALLAALLLLIAPGCDLVKEENDDAPPSRVYVANQGNFTDGNGSVTVYDPETDERRPSAISGLGSIVQSVKPLDGRLYVMSNSGNRIDVFDTETLEQLAQIDDVVSPRYLLDDGSTGYVTSLFGAIGEFTGGLVTVLDIASNTKVKEIEVGDNPEGLALVGNRLHVANHGFGAGRTLNVIDTETQAVVDTIDVDCDGPRFLAADKDDDVFVFCTGNTVYGDEGIVSQTSGAVRVVDGETGDIITRIDLDGQIGTTGPGQDAYYAAEDEMMYAVLESSIILAFDAETNSHVDSIGPFDGSPIGAVAFDSNDNRLYLGRSNGFTGAGEVSIHMADGSEVNRFDAGIVPTFIAFAGDE